MAGPVDPLRLQKTRKRILVVDDDPDIVGLLREQLAWEGYQIDVAYDGLAAIDRAVAFQPDLVLLDIMMPKVDGWVVCHSLKHHPDTRHIKIIIISVLNKIQERLRGMDIHQADFYLCKPFDLEDLSRAVEKLLGLSALSVR